LSHENEHGVAQEQDEHARTHALLGAGCAIELILVPSAGDLGIGVSFLELRLSSGLFL